MPRMANWDTRLGYQLYCEGKSDGEIADECKVMISTVKAMRLNKWRKNPDGGRSAPPAKVRSSGEEIATAPAEPHNENDDLKEKEVAGVPVVKMDKADTARMMEVIAKMTANMGGIKAVCVGNIVQALWNLNSVDDIRDARNILDWLEENFDFG